MICPIALSVWINGHRENPKIHPFILNTDSFKGFLLCSCYIKFPFSTWSLSQAAFILNILKRILESKNDTSELIAIPSQAIFVMNIIYWISCCSLPTFHCLLKFPGLHSLLSYSSVTRWMIQKVNNEDLWGQWITVLQEKKKKKTCDQIGHVAFLLIKTVLQDLSVPQASG